MKSVTSNGSICSVESQSRAKTEHLTKHVKPKPLKHPLSRGMSWRYNDVRSRQVDSFRRDRYLRRRGIGPGHVAYPGYSFLCIVADGASGGSVLRFPRTSAFIISSDHNAHRNVFVDRAWRSGAPAAGCSLGLRHAITLARVHTKWQPHTPTLKQPRVHRDLYVSHRDSTS